MNHKTVFEHQIISNYTGKVVPACWTTVITYKKFGYVFWRMTKPTAKQLRQWKKQVRVFAHG